MTTRVTVVQVVLAMLSLAAVLMSWPTTAEPVTARSSPAGGRVRSSSTHSMIRLTATRVVFAR